MVTFLRWCQDERIAQRLEPLHIGVAFEILVSRIDTARAAGSADPMRTVSTSRAWLGRLPKARPPRPARSGQRSDIDLPGQQRRRRRVHRRHLPAQPAHARRLCRPLERMGDLVSRELPTPRHQPHTQGSYGVARGLSLPIQRPVPIPGHRPGQRAGLTVDLSTNQCSKCSNTPST
jgi:hypothetical protein